MIGRTLNTARTAAQKWSVVIMTKFNHTGHKALWD